MSESSGLSGSAGDIERVVVVGAGMAGARTCQELRDRGYAGDLVLLGAESRPPYDRPPLSKAFLLGDPPDHAEEAALELDPQWHAGAELRLGVTATGLAPGVLHTTAGEFGWDALVLATGAAPIRLSSPAADPDLSGGSGGAEPTAPIPHVLRTVDDALRLRTRLTSGAQVVVVGAGWIGAEVTTAALHRGCRVTVVEAGPAPLAVPLGTSVGARTAGWYAQAGATLRCHTRVTALDDGGAVLDNGERLAADVLVEAVGVRRDLDWLVGSGVRVDGGVVTDASCRTSVPGVLAVGDCAARWSPRAGRRFLTEHWDDALRAPGVAARVLLGRHATYDPVPYVWSEQFGRYLQWVGWRDGDPAVWRGDPAGESGWAAGWLDGDGRLVGFLAVDRPRDLLAARRLIADGHRPDLARLADVDTPVRDS